MNFDLNFMIGFLSLMLTAGVVYFFQNNDRNHKFEEIDIYAENGKKCGGEEGKFGPVEVTMIHHPYSEDTEEVSTVEIHVYSTSDADFEAILYYNFICHNKIINSSISSTDVQSSHTFKLTPDLISCDRKTSVRFYAYLKIYDDKKSKINETSKTDSVSLYVENIDENKMLVSARGISNSNTLSPFDFIVEEVK